MALVSALVWALALVSASVLVSALVLALVSVSALALASAPARAGMRIGRMHYRRKPTRPGDGQYGARYEYTHVDVPLSFLIANPCNKHGRPKPTKPMRATGNSMDRPSVPTKGKREAIT